MALRDILTSVCSEIGWRIDDDRALAIRYINMAAKELYECDDYPGCLREAVIQILPGSQLALPDTVGWLRAVREYVSTNKIELNTLHPRYGYNNWPKAQGKWRIKGTSPLMLDITNASILYFQTQKLEDAVISISGKTAISNRVTEDITMDAYTKLSVNAYAEVYSIQRKVRGDYDITIKNAQGTTLAILRNDQIESRYTIIDVSQYPFGTQYYSAGEVYCEILYKVPFNKFYEDSDTFPCEGFDEALAMRTCCRYYQQQDDKAKLANNYFTRSLQLIAATIHNAEGAVQKQIMFGPPKLKGMFPRITGLPGYDNFGGGYTRYV